MCGAAAAVQVRVGGRIRSGAIMLAGVAWHLQSSSERVALGCVCADAVVEVFTGAACVGSKKGKLFEEEGVSLGLASLNMFDQVVDCEVLCVRGDGVALISGWERTEWTLVAGNGNG